MSESFSITGRLVWGHPEKSESTDMQGKPRTIKSGPSAGQPLITYPFGVAIAKIDPEWPAFQALCEKAAKDAKPHLFGADGKCVLPSFSWKIKDGDVSTLR